MSRFIFFALLFCFIFFWLKRKFKVASPKPSDKQNQDGEQHMVKCASCQLHIPANEAFMQNQTPYCCEDHAK